MFEKLPIVPLNESFIYTNCQIISMTIMSAVCCGVRGRALISHTGVRGLEPHCDGAIAFINLLTTVRKYLDIMKKGGGSEFTIIGRSI